MPRLIAIGDVHGCVRELDDLLEKLSPDKDDQLYFLGDLINVGPNSQGVLERIRNLPHVRCLLGNHELRLLQYHRDKDPRILKPYDPKTLKTLGEAEWKQLSEFEERIHLPEVNTLLVHGGLLPDTPWATQPITLISQIQVIDPQTGAWGKRADIPEGTPWADQWQGPPFVLYGHTPRKAPYQSPWALGIDTGCVYGGHLSACDLQTRTITQVKARKCYANKTG